MTNPPPADAAPHVAAYVERLRVPLVWWAIPVFFLAALTWGFTLYLGPVAGAAILAVMIALVVTTLLAYGNLRLRVTADRFTAGDAWLPMSAVGAVYPLDAGQARALRGPRADARAHLVLRGYIPVAVRVDVDDAADPTPYWYVSTRRPHELAAALSAARDRARGNLKGGG